MKRKHVSELQQRINDFTHFSYVLISLSLFLYIGSFIPTIIENQSQQVVLQLISYTAVFGAIYFCRKARKLKNKSDEDQNMSI